ncbi:MAG: hypothetical protein RR397_01805 [Odoribacter sp.]
MRRIVFLFLSVLLSASVFAQEPGATEKNAGNDAVKAKNYAEAFKKYEEYLKIVNYKDNATVFNTAFCANKIKNYPAAEKYFDMSIKNKYKTASAYQGKAKAQKSQNKDADMMITLKEGLKASPGNMKLETMYATYYLKEGQKFQKAGNEVKAAESYNKITELTTKSFKTQGYVSLASLYFNNGAKILQDATPIANSDKAKYDAEKVKAVNDFKKAKDFLVQAQSLEPANQDVKDLMKQVNEAMK